MSGINLARTVWSRFTAPKFFFDPRPTNVGIGLASLPCSFTRAHGFQLRLDAVHATTQDSVESFIAALDFCQPVRQHRQVLHPFHLSMELSKILPDDLDLDCCSFIRAADRLFREMVEKGLCVHHGQDLFQVRGGAQCTQDHHLLGAPWSATP